MDTSPPAHNVPNQPAYGGSAASDGSQGPRYHKVGGLKPTQLLWDSTKYPNLDLDFLNRSDGVVRTMGHEGHNLSFCTMFMNRSFHREDLHTEGFQSLPCFQTSAADRREARVLRNWGLLEDFRVSMYRETNDRAAFDGAFDYLYEGPKDGLFTEGINYTPDNPLARQAAAATPASAASMDDDFEENAHEGQPDVPNNHYNEAFDRTVAVLAAKVQAPDYPQDPVGAIPKKYWPCYWNETTRQLDMQLFGVLTSSITGPALHYLQNANSSYIQAVSIIYQKGQTLSVDRKLSTLADLEKLQFTGDLTRFEQTASRIFTTIQRQEITIFDVILVALRNAFEGRSTQAQFLVGKSLGNRKLISMARVHETLRNVCQAVGDSGTQKAPNRVQYAGTPPSNGKGGGKGQYQARKPNSYDRNKNRNQSGHGRGDQKYRPRNPGRGDDRDQKSGSDDITSAVRKAFQPGQRVNSVHWSDDDITSAVHEAFHPAEEENAVHWTQNDIETAIHQAFLPAHRVNTVYWSQDDHGFPIEPEFVVESDDELDINEIDEDEEPPDLLSESDSQPEGDDSDSGEEHAEAAVAERSVTRNGTPYGIIPQGDPWHDRERVANRHTALRDLRSKAIAHQERASVQNTPEQVTEIDEVDEADTRGEISLETPFTPDLNVEIDMKQVDPGDSEATRREWQPSDETYTPNNVAMAPGKPQHKLLDLKRDSGRFKTRFPVTGHGSVTWIDTASGPTLHYTKEPWCLPDAAERYHELMSELKKKHGIDSSTHTDATAGPPPDEGWGHSVCAIADLHLKQVQRFHEGTARMDKKKKAEEALQASAKAENATKTAENPTAVTSTPPTKVLQTADPRDEGGVAVEDDEEAPAIDDIEDIVPKPSEETSRVFMAKGPWTETQDKGKENTKKKKLAINLFGGIGGAAQAIKDLDLINRGDIDHIIDVEIDSKARKMCAHAHPKTLDFPGVEHWLHDVTAINQGDLERICKKYEIVLITAGWPCQGLSRLRDVMPDGTKRKGPSHRAGIHDGDRSGLFYHLKRIYDYLKARNPNMHHLIENIDFSDKKDQWNEVCDTFGTPIVVQASDYSYTHRKRAYWTDVTMPGMDVLFHRMGPLNPNDCLDPGRYLAPDSITTVTASWRGHPFDPEQYTARPIIIWDDKTNGEVRHNLRIHEAERLHHLDVNSTFAEGLHPIHRLKGVGNGWDRSIVERVMGYIFHPEDYGQRTIAAIPSNEVTTDERHAIEALMKLSEEECVKQILSMPYHLQHHAATLVLTGSQAKQRVMNAKLASEYIILDSGSSRHISPEVNITDPDAQKPLLGFSGEKTWTQGVGELEISYQDEYKGRSGTFKVPDVDKVKTAETALLSVGKMVDDGCKVRLEGPDDMHLYIPVRDKKGHHKVKIGMAMNGILTIPKTPPSQVNMAGEGDEHEDGVNDTLGNGIPPPRDCTLPEGVSEVIIEPKLHVTGRNTSKSLEELHGILNHMPAERILDTVAVTHGFNQPNLPRGKLEHVKGCKCDACAQGAARKRGASQKHVGYKATPGQAARTALQDEIFPINYVSPFRVNALQLAEGDSDTEEVPPSPTPPGAHSQDPIDLCSPDTPEHPMEHPTIGTQPVSEGGLKEGVAAIDSKHVLEQGMSVKDTFASSVSPATPPAKRTKGPDGSDDDSDDNSGYTDWEELKASVPEFRESLERAICMPWTRSHEDLIDLHDRLKFLEDQDAKLFGALRYIRNCEENPTGDFPNYLAIICGEEATTVVLDNEGCEIEELKDSPPGLTRVRVPVAMKPQSLSDGGHIPGTVTGQSNQDWILLDLRIHLDYEMTETAKELIRTNAEITQIRERYKKRAAAAAASQDLD